MHAVAWRGGARCVLAFNTARAQLAAAATATAVQARRCAD